jgi:DNA polymerase-3 subunit alpha
MNKKSLDALIRSGALDDFEDRNIMLQNMEEALAYNKGAAGAASQNQSSLFNLIEDKQTLPGLKLKEALLASAEEKLNWERELLGLYISGHPLDKFKEKLAKLKHSVGDAKKLPNETSVVIGGMIEEVRKIMTKKNEPMAFIKVSDYENTIEAVVFPRVLKMYESKIREGACVGIKGKISVRNGDTSIIIDEMKEMSI